VHCAEKLGLKGQNDKALAIYDSLRNMKQAPRQVRTGALRGAVVMRHHDGLPLLMEAVRSSDYWLVQAAARIAMELKEPATSKMLANELGKASADKQILLCNVIGKRGDAAALPALYGLAQNGDTDAVPLLLELAKNSTEERDRILCLLGCLSMAGNETFPKKKRLSICKQAAPLASRIDEKKMLFVALGKLADPESLNLLTPCLEDPALKKVAISAVMAIAEKNVKNKHTNAVKPALKTVVKVCTDNPAMMKRAKKLLEQIEDHK